MRALLVPVFALLLVGSALAQSELTEEDKLAIAAVKSVIRGRLTIIEGTVYDKVSQDPVGEGNAVRVYCMNGGNQNLISSTETNSQGFFTAWTWNFQEDRLCEAGDLAWTEIDYMGSTSESDKITVVQGALFKHASVNSWVGVPEFSTITLGAAIVGVGVGLAFLRKRK